MKGLSIFALAATIVGTAATGNPDGCNGNNCFNQVGATRFGTTTYLARLSDCATSLAFTVTPDASYTTTTVTVSPTVPAWASGCKSYGAFSTACVCNGFSPVTVTAPTPIVTVTVTSTLTAQNMEVESGVGILMLNGRTVEEGQKSLTDCACISKRIQ